MKQQPSKKRAKVMLTVEREGERADLWATATAAAEKRANEQAQTISESIDSLTEKRIATDLERLKNGETIRKISSQAVNFFRAGDTNPESDWYGKGRVAYAKYREGLIAGANKLRPWQNNSINVVAYD